MLRPLCRRLAIKANRLPRAFVPLRGDGTFLRASDRMPTTAPYTVLGIETSCDDTGVAIVSSDGKVLGEARASQAALHDEWGGVNLDVARDAHMDALDRVIAQAISCAGMDSVAGVDAIAVTVGPGLEVCLRVGCEAAKSLALAHDKPFVGVHHLEAHALMARLAVGREALEFPFLTLLTSGGHCQLLQTTGVGEHAVLGTTTDDALGEAFDKVARLLELPVGGGGGAALEALAREGNSHAHAFSVPLRTRKNFDFSFSGLKSAVRRAVERAPPSTACPASFRADIAASFQRVAFEHVEQRCRYAMAYFASTVDAASDVATDVRAVARAGGGEGRARLSASGRLSARPLALVVSGGVAANSELRRRLERLCAEQSAVGDPGHRNSWRLVVPPPRLCTDNGVMVAWAAVEALEAHGTSHQAEGQLVRARWPLGRAAKGAHVPGGTPSHPRANRKAVAG